jgi:hypothetical protein
MGYEWRLTECEQDMWQGLMRGYKFCVETEGPPIAVSTPITSKII